MAWAAALRAAGAPQLNEMAERNAITAGVRLDPAGKTLETDPFHKPVRRRVLCRRCRRQGHDRSEQMKLGYWSRNH